MSSDRLAAREEIFLCGKSHEGTDAIFDKLLHVSSLRENDLYDFDTEAPPLGTGERSLFSVVCNLPHGTMRVVCALL